MWITHHFPQDHGELTGYRLCEPTGMLRRIDLDPAMQLAVMARQKQRSGKGADAGWCLYPGQRHLAQLHRAQSQQGCRQSSWHAWHILLENHRTRRDGRCPSLWCHELCQFGITSADAGF
ncbi:hypothetical protein D3C85_1418620 [compost metagenome]